MSAKPCVKCKHSKDKRGRWERFTDRLFCTGEYSHHWICIHPECKDTQTVDAVLGTVSISTTCCSTSRMRFRHLKNMKLIEERIPRDTSEDCPKFKVAGEKRKGKRRHRSKR